jgi:hypothetical protein
VSRKQKTQVGEALCAKTWQKPTTVSTVMKAVTIDRCELDGESFCM